MSKPVLFHATRASALVPWFLLCGAAETASATAIVVNSASDAVANDGSCTLREAIAAANTNAASGGAAGECAAGQASPTVDTIAFAIGSGLHTIAPSAAYPPLVEAVVIDGYTQPGSSANTLTLGDDAVFGIEIDFSNTPPGFDLLRTQANGCTIRGLVIDHGAGVNVMLASDNNVVEGNYLGTGPAGMTFAGSIYTTIRTTGSSNRIGGATPAARNVIAASGGSNAGTIMVGGTGNVIKGNYIGITADGSAALHSNSAPNGIEIGTGGTASATQIGGSAAGEGNVITATNVAIRIGGNVHNTVIEGNYIGTDATGTKRLGASIGISTDNGPDHTTIGGAAPGAGNVISGNGTGIYLVDGAAATIIRGNRIGTDPGGSTPVANAGSGMFIFTASNGSAIGGSNPGEGNTIAFNCGAGITFFPSANVFSWPMLGNTIYSNAGLGISLNNNGTPAANDAGDLDDGTNKLQNHPVISAAPVAAGSADLAGTLNSLPNKTYRLEFFSGIGCHASGSGEGRHFLGSLDVITDGNGNAGFGAGTAQFAVPAGHSVFTATATDPDGNTSEFSACFGTPALVFHDDFEGGCSGYD